MQNCNFFFIGTQQLFNLRRNKKQQQQQNQRCKSKKSWAKNERKEVDKDREGESGRRNAKTNHRGDPRKTNFVRRIQLN